MEHLAYTNYESIRIISISVIHSAHAVVSTFATQMPAQDDKVAMRLGYKTLFSTLIN